MGKWIGIMPGPEYMRHTDYEEDRKDQNHDQMLVPHLWSNQAAGCLVEPEFVPRTGCGPTSIAFQSSDFA